MRHISTELPESVSLNDMERNRFENFEEIYVLFSGGTDSTVLLDDLCKRHYDIPEFRNFINIVYIEDIRLGMNKIKKEKETIKRLLKMFRKRYPKITFNHIIIKYTIQESIKTNAIGLNAYGSKQNRGYLVQPIMWLSSIMSYLDFANNSVILFGYNHDDCARTIIMELARIANGYSNILDKDISVKFPIIDMTKKDVLAYLTKDDKLNITWTCEQPISDEETGNIIKCEKCHSCITLNSNLLMLER